MFTWCCSANTYHNRFPLFRSWLRGSNVSSIAERSRGCGRDTLFKTIHWYLDHSPKPDPIPNPNCPMIIDGTWFGRDNCLIIYWDADLKHIQWWRYSGGERVWEVWEDLKRLKEAGVILKSATSDGGRGIVGALRIAYPDIPHQRCVTHLQRHTLAWVTRRPRTEAGKKIKPLVQWLSEITSFELHDQWIGEFKGWCNQWEEFLKEQSYSDDSKHWWYTHKQLRRVRSSITNAIPNLFHYLEDPTIPKTSNGLEGRFGSFKRHYKQHRGLSKKRREAYIAWYSTSVVNRESPTRNQY